MPLKVFSQDAEMCLLHNIPREDRAGGRRRGNGSFSGTCPVLGLGLCLLFLLKCLDWENLQTFKFSTHIFFWPGMFVFNYLLFPTIVKTSSSPWCPRAFSSLSVSQLSTENEFSEWISDEFSKWISDFQLVNIFPLWEINTERYWYPRFPWGCGLVLGS